MRYGETRVTPIWKLSFPYKGKLFDTWIFVNIMNLFGTDALMLELKLIKFCDFPIYA